MSMAKQERSARFRRGANSASTGRPHELDTLRSEGKGESRSRVWKLLGGLLVLGIVILIARQGADVVSRLLESMRGLGPWAGAAFVGLYAAATVAWVPGSLLTLAAGAIFGLAYGTLYVFTGAVLGSVAAFLIARSFARPAVERRVADSARFKAIDRAIGGQGRKIVFLLRLSPAFPYNLLNYALGLTTVRFRDYLIASIGMLPWTFMYVYYGKLAGDVAALAVGANPERGAGYYVLLTVGLVATLGVVVLVTRIARRALREATEA